MLESIQFQPDKLRENRQYVSQYNIQNFKCCMFQWPNTFMVDSDSEVWSCVEMGNSNKPLFTICFEFQKFLSLEKSMGL